MTDGGLDGPIRPQILGALWRPLHRSNRWGCRHELLEISTPVRQAVGNIYDWNPSLHLVEPDGVQYLTIGVLCLWHWQLALDEPWTNHCELRLLALRRLGGVISTSSRTSADSPGSAPPRIGFPPVVLNDFVPIPLLKLREGVPDAVAGGTCLSTTLQLVSAVNLRRCPRSPP